jgi:hypothetical protein
MLPGVLGIGWLPAVRNNALQRKCCMGDHEVQLCTVDAAAKQQGVRSTSHAAAANEAAYAAMNTQVNLQQLLQPAQKCFDNALVR